MMMEKNRKTIGLYGEDKMANCKQQEVKLVLNLLSKWKT